MRFLSVFKKDIKLEFKNKLAISSLVLFIFTSIILIYFSVSGAKLEKPVVSGIFLVIIFFSLLQGLSSNFLNEDEKGTSYLLKLNFKPFEIYLAKLLFNIILSILTFFISSVLFLIFIDGFSIQNFVPYLLSFILGSIAISSGITILSALIISANSKMSLLAVLTFPVLLPALISSNNLLKMALGEIIRSSVKTESVNLLIYIGIINVISWLFFDEIWND